MTVEEYVKKMIAEYLKDKDDTFDILDLLDKLRKAGFYVEKEKVFQYLGEAE